MFLDYIEISNYRPYYGTQKINFGYSDEKNLTIILADNGSGKTSLVNALTWCLYGKELHDVKDKTEPLYNLKIAKEIEENNEMDNLTVSVKINFYYFDDNHNKNYFKISRELPYYKIGNSEWTSSFEDYLVVEETNKDLLDNELAQNAIDNKIPEDMFQYFFFNGATLSNYFNNESETSLKKSIEQISQINLINKVSDHLNKTLTWYNDNYKKIKPSNERNYNSEILDKKNQKHLNQNKIEENYEKIDSATNNIKNYENELDKIDSDSLNKLTSERKTLENDIGELKIIINQNTKKYEQLILEIYPIVTLFDVLVDAYNIADNARVNKTAPPKIERQLLNDILEDGSCICGIDLNEHPECIIELKSRLEKTSKIDKDTFYDEYYNIKNLLNKLKELPQIENLKSDINQDIKNKKEKEIQVEDISNEISNFNIENVKLYENQLKENKKTREELRKENEKLANFNKRLENEIKQLETARKNEEEVLDEAKELNDKIEFSEKALDEVNQLNKSVQKHIREKIIRQTKKQFTSIKWAYKKYTDVTIDPNYKIKITKTSGIQVAPGDLSDGEENLLALSFMMALHSLNGFEIPLIIDAPLEKLDKNKRLEFISGLHDYTSEKQIVFLFTDTQYTNDVRTEMIKYVNDEYKLIPRENETEIVKHD